MGKLRPVHFSGIHDSNGDQISDKVVRETLERHPMRKLELTHAFDELERGQIFSQSSFQNPKESVALHLKTDLIHNGLRHQRYLFVSAFAFKGDNRLSAEQTAQKSEKRETHLLPGQNAALFKEIYVGDINGDRFPDLLVVMQNGAGLVLYQQKP